MQAGELKEYIEHPARLDAKSVERLQKLASDFPYFQSAHILLSLASKKWDASVYQQSLRKTAITVSNRSHLFSLIHQLENTPATAEILNDTEPEISQKKIEEKESEKVVIQPTEETRHELDILKAAELTVEREQPEQKAPEKPDLDEQVETEMGKQLVQAFIEKEVLKTPELHNPVVKEEAPASFNDWLTYVKHRRHSPEQEQSVAPPMQKPEEPPAPQTPAPSELRKQKNKAIIDKIIENSPGLIKVKEETKFFTPDSKAKESLQENEHLVTETLARIYALQGNVNKAVRAYEILSLKFPQKSAYFATLIQKLKNNK